MGDLRKKLKFLQGKPLAPGELWAVRINSGKFGVKWERTKRVLEQCGLDMKVVRPLEDESQGEITKEGKHGKAIHESPKVESSKDEAKSLEDRSPVSSDSKDTEEASQGQKRKAEAGTEELATQDNVSPQNPPPKDKKRRKKKKQKSEKRQAD